jgi:hypothetical protein
MKRIERNGLVQHGPRVRDTGRRSCGAESGKGGRVGREVRGETRHVGRAAVPFDSGDGIKRTGKNFFELGRW